MHGQYARSQSEVDQGTAASNMFCGQRCDRGHLTSDPYWNHTLANIILEVNKHCPLYGDGESVQQRVHQSPNYRSTDEEDVSHGVLHTSSEVY